MIPIDDNVNYLYRQQMFRKVLFWTHLAVGIATGLVILMMSVTGVILTYERQMLDWANRSHYQPPRPGAERLPIADLVAAVQHADPDFEATGVSIASDPAAPVLVTAGRQGSRFVNGYTGEILDDHAASMRAFFGAVTGWHRWFNKTGPDRAPWRALTGASNLAFLFLIASGLYLWLPKMWRWAAFRTRLIFRPMAATSHARDFNWHHFFGFWTAVPLAIVIATAVVFSYSWGNDLVYEVFGETPPGQAAPLSTTSDLQTPVAGIDRSISTDPRTLDELFTIASTRLADWRQITVMLPSGNANEVRFSLDLANGGMPQRRHTLTLDATTGDTVDWMPFQSQTPGRQARSWVRFLHTGEALGVIGQTIAGLVSLTSILMVYTGYALAYRRLIAPWMRRRRNTTVSVKPVSDTR